MVQKYGVKESFKKLAQLGYSARGVVYLVVGGLALMAAFGEGGKTTDSKGAILTVHQQPFGEFLLIIMILGLFGYVSWRLVQGIRDTDNHGAGFKGIAVRGGLLVSAITHAALAFWAIKLLLGESDSSSNSQSQGLLATDYGQWIIAVIGVCVIGAGFAHIYKGWTARFERYMDLPADKRSWAQPICRFGLIARGVVWCILGIFFLQSAWRASTDDLAGMSAALESLQQNTFGPWLLGVVAAGLFAFGIYSILEAMYRRINPDIPV